MRNWWNCINWKIQTVLESVTEVPAVLNLISYIFEHEDILW